MKTQSHTSNRICEHCDTEFRCPPSQRGRFCSPKCWYAHNHGENNPNYAAPIPRVCDICDKRFEAYPSVPGRFCSKRCLGIANGRRHAASFERLTYRCATCNEEGRVSPSSVGRTKFCSRECAATAMRTASDYRYGPDWARQRRKAKVRDQHTCQTCGDIKNLHVHHKSPYRISGTNALRNLVTLCASCHTTEEARYRAAEEQHDRQLPLFTRVRFRPLTTSR